MSVATIALLLPDLAVGGLQTMAVGLAEALDPCRFRPRFYTFDGEGPLAARLDAAGFGHRFRPRGEGVSPGYAAGLARQFAEDGVDLVHCHNVTALFHGARAARRLGHLPVVFTEHGRPMPSPWKHRLLHAWLARKVDRAAIVCQHLADGLVRYEGFPRRRTEAVLNGIPDPRTSMPDDRATARAALGWDDRPVALVVGSLTEVKNQRALVEAWARLPADVGARLLLAGEGPLHDELARAASAAPAGAVELLGRRDDVPRLLAAADVFVLPSHREGLSLGLIEAHAMGRPSVAFGVGGNAEVLVHDETGLLAPYPDIARFVDALVGLLRDQGRARRLGDAARTRYLACFTHARMVERYAAIYDELLAARAR